MSDAAAIFDAVGKLGKAIIEADKRNCIHRDIQSLKAKECGHCDYWMKSTCRPEKELGQFKSCSSYGCKDFSRNDAIHDLIAKREAELKEKK